MFAAGDLVVYGGEGVCRVERIGPSGMSYDDGDRLYYHLTPLYRSGMVLTPVDTGVLMRPVMTAQDAAGFLAALPALAAAFLNAFWPLYRAGPRSGYLDEYRRRQALTGQRVLVTPRRGTPRAAQVQGIDDECKLVVRFDGESRPAALNSGEVSVRLL